MSTLNYQPELFEQSTAPRRRKPSAPAFVKVLRIAEVPPAKFDMPDVVANYWQEHITSRPEFDPCKEFLYVFVLDTKYNVVGVNMVSCGSLNESVALPREIFRPAIALAGYAIMLAHNHPSGDPSPSEADRRMTSRIVDGGKLLQISVLDHVIIGKPSSTYRPFFSFREAGLM